MSAPANFNPWPKHRRPISSWEDVHEPRTQAKHMADEFDWDDYCPVCSPERYARFSAKHRRWSDLG